VSLRFPAIDPLSLAGRAVLVAGAGGGGIGTSVSRLLADAGAAVIAFDMVEGNLEPTADALRDAGAAWIPVVGDAREPADVERALDEGAGLGPLHGLVSVAGGLFPEQWSSIVELDLSTFDEVVRLNLHSAFVTSSAVARRLITQGNGGSLVTLSSIVSLSAMPFGAPYAAAKAGLLTLTRTAALELAPHRIRANAVVAGTIRTERNLPTSAVAGDPVDQAAIPLGRRGEPDDIAGAALFLLSDLSSYVTGQTVVVDGGLSTRPSYIDDENLPVFVRDTAMRKRILGG